MPAFVAAIHVLKHQQEQRRGWPGHRRAKRRRSSNGYARPWTISASTSNHTAPPESQGLELPGAAEAPQIGRHDRLHRALLDAEPLEGAALVDRGRRHDIVLAQELDLVGREQRLG